MKHVAAQFAFLGRFSEAARFGSGHIHDTYRVHCDTPDGAQRYILQRLNTHVFRDPLALMENLTRVCAHQQSALAARGLKPERRALTLIPARDGRGYWVDTEGHYWRAFPFMEGTRSLDTVETEAQAYEVGRAFGEFIDLLRGLEGPPLAVTIPHFHDLSYRYQALEAAIHSDSHQRAKTLGAEIEGIARWFTALEGELESCGAAAAPRRIVHNDCKINNLLLDANSGAARCVIDLDTVMEGTLLADFGELMRTSTSRVPEDEVGVDAMALDLELVRGVARGFLAATHAFLSPLEMEILPLAGPVLALENAIRFLTDYLAGDVYFSIQRPAHNLERFRAQLRRVELMSVRRDAICETLEQARREGPAVGAA